VSTDGYQTQDMFFAATLLYLYGHEAIDKIYLDDKSRATFLLKVPSLDVAEYLTEYEAGQLAVSDLKSLRTSWEFLGGTIRFMKRQDMAMWQNDPQLPRRLPN